MTKPAIAYGVVREPYGAEFHVFEITTERGLKVWGRDHNGDPSSRAARDVVGRFVDPVAATTARDAVRAISRHHAPIVRAARDACDAAERERREAIEKALHEIRVTPVAALEPHR